MGEEIEIMKPDGRDLKVVVGAIYNEDGEVMESCPHPKQSIYADLGPDAGPFDLIRRSEKE